MAELTILPFSSTFNKRSILMITVSQKSLNGEDITVNFYFGDSFTEILVGDYISWR